MPDKKSNAKFTIQFSRKNPTHMQVAEMLNQQERGNKAQFIVDAVMFYVNSGGVRDAQYLGSVPLDEKQVEAIVHRVLKNTQAANVEAKSTPLSSTASSAGDEQPADDVGLDNSEDALDADGLNAVANVLDMFRKK